MDEGGATTIRKFERRVKPVVIDTFTNDLANESCNTRLIFKKPKRFRNDHAIVGRIIIGYRAIEPDEWVVGGGVLLIASANCSTVSAPIKPTTASLCLGS